MEAGSLWKVPFLVDGRIHLLDAVAFSIDLPNRTCTILFTKPLAESMRACDQFKSPSGCTKVDCEHSHGYVVSFEELIDDSSTSEIFPGKRCYAPRPNGLWLQAVIVSILDAETASIRFSDSSESIPVSADQLWCPSDRDLSETSDSSTGSELDRSDSDSFSATPGAKKQPTGFADWEKHTKGIGSKLLAKMGYKPVRSFETVSCLH